MKATKKRTPNERKSPWPNTAMEVLKALRKDAWLDTEGQSLVTLAFFANRVIRDAMKELLEAHKRETIPQKMQTVAWKHVYHALWSAVSAMNHHAEKNPSLFGFAANCCYWPVVKSPGVGFQEEEPDEKLLFRTLAVGERMEGFKVVGTKWRPSDPVGCLAVDLWHRVFNHSFFLLPLDGDDSPKDRKLARRFRERAGRLPPFRDPGAWQKWWSLAEEVLEWRWGQPAERARLEQLVTAKSKQGSPGRLKAQLVSMLKDRFKSMAGENKS